jgi:hypothetical protein
MGYIGAGLTRFNTADELTVTGDAEFDGNLTVKGTHITLDSATVQTVDLGDNDKIRLGDSDDLQIYHDSSDSYITESGTGSLYIGADSTIALTDAAVTQNKAQFITGGAVNLFHNNAQKFATTATGVDVTGTVTADGLTVSGDAVFEPDNDGVRITGANYATLRLEENDTTDLNTTMFNSGGKFSIFTSSDDRASGTERVTLDHSTGNVGIGITPFANNIGNGLDIASGAGMFGSSNSNYLTGNLYYSSGWKYKASAGGALILLDSASSIKFNTAASGTAGGAATLDERMRIDTSGNVGIGTSSPTYKLQVGDATADTRAVFNPNTGFAIGVANGGGFAGWIGGSGVTDNMVFSSSGGSERMRIDSSGNLRIGTTAAQITAERVSITGGLGIQKTDGYPLGLIRGNTYGQIATFFNYSGSLVGSINVAASSTSYNTSSDYRLKTAVEYDWDATTRLKQLRPARFEWIADGDDAVPVDGFLAHEVQDIVPEAISGTKDGMRDEEYEVSAATGDIYTPAVEATYDEDGVEVTAAIDEVIHSTDVEQPEELAEGQQWRETTAAVMGTRSVPDYQGIDQSKLVPLLVKTIQELEARIAALETA